MRTKKSMKNFLFSSIPAILIAIIGIFKIKIFLNYLGDELVGIYQLFSNFFSYISLLDAGLSGSALYSLYKPVSKDNKKKINNILSAVKSYFNKIAVIIMFFGFILSFFIMFFIKETSVSQEYIQICMILYFVSNSINYFIISHTLLNEAEQNIYKNYRVFYTLNVIKSIIEIILVMSGLSLLSIMISYTIIAIINNALILYFSKKDHPYLDFKAPKDNSFKKEMKNLAVGKIGGLIFNNIDLIFISKFLGLTKVVVYTSYGYITNMLMIIISKISSSVLPGIGNLLAKEKEKAKDVFFEYNSFTFFISSVIIVPLLFCITPFISLWYGEKYVMGITTSTLFITLFFLKIIRIPLNTFMDASGAFIIIRKCVIVESIINLILSIFLIKPLGIPGVLIATIVSLIFGTFIVYPKFITNTILRTDTKEYYFRSFKMIVFSIINVILINLIFSYIYISNLLIWFLTGIGIFIINFILMLGYFKYTNEFKFMKRILKVLRKEN